MTNTQLMEPTENWSVLLFREEMDMCSADISSCDNLKYTYDDDILLEASHENCP